MPASKRDLIVLSNRLPVRRVTRGGRREWRVSPGGLVSALTPVLRERQGTWVGWTGTIGPVLKPFLHDGIRNHPVPLSQVEVEGFYEGFSNRSLWPLYHDLIRTPEYHRVWWRPYEAVETAAEIARPGATIWVNDYHLQLVPGMVRKLRSDVRIGFFLHIPFPPQELFSQLPWRREILEGLVAADVVGFQTRGGAANFTALAKRFAGVSGPRDRLRAGGRPIRAGAFPVSVDVRSFEEIVASPDVILRSEHQRTRLRARKLILGVDRLDYTKGIDLRLRSFRDLLRSGRVNPADVVLVQVAVPSRERVDDYRELRLRVEQLVGEINGEFGELGRVPVQYLHRNLDREELVALYRAADVLVVTPFRDGMNLVAKEYVACRLDNTGVLVLSEFTGSARELGAALLVNPYDVDAVATAMERALAMPVKEQRKRMSRLRRVVRGHTVFDWAHAFLGAVEA